MKVNFKFEEKIKEVNVNEIKNLLNEILNDKNFYLKNLSDTANDGWKFKITREVGIDGLNYYHILLIDLNRQDGVVEICTIFDAAEKEVEVLYDQCEKLNFEFGVVEPY